jgi:hypothetical protein
MFSFPGLGLLVACGVTGWAVWWGFLSALAATRMKEELRANRLLLVDQALKAADEQAGKETALHLLDQITKLRESDLRAMTARLDALQAKYDTVRQLYQDSIAIDGPLASKRIQ